jgi:hypothetical protein
MDIRIWADKANRQLFIRDRGIGMSQVRGSNPSHVYLCFDHCSALIICIWADKANRQLFIRDRGIGTTQVRCSNPELFMNVVCLICFFAPPSDLCTPIWANKANMFAVGAGEEPGHRRQVRHVQLDFL